MDANYRQLINNWHAKASEEDYFSKFVFEYMAYIAFLMKVKFENVRNERAAVQRLKRDIDIKERYLQRIDNRLELSEAWRNIKGELDRSPLGNASRNRNYIEELPFWNCPHDHDNQKTPHENTKASGVIHDLADWENMIEFWQAIRNNLFHGTKNPEDDRDQLLTENGFKTLRPLVEILLSNHRRP